MADNKNKGSGEFDDGGFDDDFADVNFDETSFESEAAFDEAGEESEYEGDDFESEDWGEAEETAPAAKGKKTKQKSSGGGLSFNTIVIIGAVVLGGGVLAFNVMRETEKKEAAAPSMFQSILNISGVMDGTLLGEKKEETPADAEGAAQQNGGFLNDPGTTATPAPTAEGTPPQPTPIAPADGAVATGEPLTPMPMPSTEAPRGPDEVPPTEASLATDTTPSETSAVPQVQEATVPPPDAPAENVQSAEDILKQAMANREQKQEEAVTGDTPPSPTDKEALEDDLEKKIEAAKDKTEEVAENVVTDIKEAVDPAPATDLPAMPAAPTAAAQAPSAAPASQQMSSEGMAAVSALSGKLDAVLARMDKIETELGDIRDDKSTDTQEMEETVAALKQDLSALKQRPASPSSATKMDDAEEEAPKPAPVKKKKAPKAPAAETQRYTPPAESIPSRTSVSSASSSASGHWELRAAQPGRAWVSRPGDRDMQAVAIGQNLPGVGRITAITYQGGRWVVTGTLGVIQQ